MIAPTIHPFDLVSRVLSERLRGRTASDDLQALLRAQSVDWNRVIGHASTDYALPAFAAALRELDLIRLLDEELGAFLQTVHAANLEHNGELGRELSTAVRILNRLGIEPILLKGAIRLVDGLYPDDGWRMMRDLDLLVPKAALASATKAFEKADYEPCGSDGEFRRPDGVCQIDLHTEPFRGSRSIPLLRMIDIEDKAQPVTFGEARAWLPSLEHQVVHLIGHSQIRHFGHIFGRVSLSNRLEAAALVCWGRSELDWHAVMTHFYSAEFRRPLLSFLLALSDGSWCTVSMTDRIDLVTALQKRRIALQARSKALSYIGSWLGVWMSVLGDQVERSDTGERRAISNLKRLISERGVTASLARTLRGRRRHLLHALPYLSCLFLY